jgi:hypothetical protein
MGQEADGATPQSHEVVMTIQYVSSQAQTPPAE